MTPSHWLRVFGLSLALAAPAPLAMAAPASPPAAADTEVEAEAVQALQRMTAYLGTLTTFDIRAETSQDLVMTDGQKVRLDGVNRYIVRRPDAFMVEVATPWKVRRLFYDGKSLTLEAPELGYYATVDAPETIRATLDAAASRYGLHVPLQDLFRWTDPTYGGAGRILGAFRVGPAKVDGVEADHFAFREEQIDWQIWIRKGEQPLPLKVLIIDRSDLSRPQFEAKLTWNMAPQMTADTFTLRPGKDAMPIKMATLKSPQ